MKSVFVHPERCIGCRQCEFACAVEHSSSKDPVGALFEDPPPRSRIHVEAGPFLNTSFPNKCRHCRPAPCRDVCPTGAIDRNDAFGLVLVHPDKCIACAVCAMVCPFDVITFHSQRNGMPARIVATKCDGCVDRAERGLEPACVEACKVEALVFGDWNELVREGRLRESARMVAASSLEPGPSEAPEAVSGWRAWGEETTEMAGGVA